MQNLLLNHKLASYNKALIVVLDVILSGLSVLYGADPRIQMLLQVATLLGVWGVPNKA